MIYLIGGPPRCGKTTVANKLSIDTGIPWVSTDTIEGMVKPYIDKADIARLFPIDTIRENTSSNEEMYNNNSATDIIRAYTAQGAITQPAIEGLIAYTLGDGHNIIIEGYHLAPKFIKEMIDQYGEKKIKAVIVTKQKSEDFINNILLDQSESCWVKNKSKNNKIYPKIANMLSQYSDKITKETNKYNLRIIEYKGDFIEQTNRAVKTLKNI